VFTAFIVVTILAAAANLYAATNDFRRLEWVLANMNRLNIPSSYLSTLGALKIAGAVGLLAGFALPSVGIAAGIGLVLFFAGAVVFTLRARWYSHLPYPTIWLLLAVGSLVLRVASA
jgi:hypothetical protein